jgi:hypothetical protein
VDQDDYEVAAQKEADLEEENPMAALEARTKESKQEMDILDGIEEIIDQNARKFKVNIDDVIKAKEEAKAQLLEERKKKREARLQAEEDAAVEAAFGGGERVKRLESSSDEDDGGAGPAHGAGGSGGGGGGSSEGGATVKASRKRANLSEDPETKKKARSEASSSSGLGSGLGGLRGMLKKKKGAKAGASGGKAGVWPVGEPPKKSQPTAAAGASSKALAVPAQTAAASLLGMEYGSSSDSSE